MDRGTPYSGKNEYLETIKDIFGGRLPAIRYAVLNSYSRENCRITADSFVHPSKQLLEDIGQYDTIAVSTDEGWVAIDVNNGNVVGAIWFENPEYRPVPDAWGFTARDTASRHLWLEKHTGKPSRDVVKETIRRAMQQEVDDHGSSWVSYMGLLEDPSLECIIFLVGYDDYDQSCIDSGALRRFLQPLFGEFVHVFSFKEYKKYMRFGKVIPIFAESDLKGVRDCVPDRGRLMDLHREAIWHGSPDEKSLLDTVRDEGTLSYIADKASYIENCIDRAAWLMWSIANYHPFAEGNKRTAYLAAQSVLRGRAIGCSDVRESEAFIRRMAAGEETEEKVREYIVAN
ncbi:MAG: Fic family protein, partial [Candidatus Methanomethylophilaceae archaeon]|nr:Fic family protein [Candidatus Methanomethylophilaceae archaeon]